jgi:hypothetical protein
VLDVREIHLGDRHHERHAFFGAYQKARVQLLPLSSIEQETEGCGEMLPSAWLRIRCRHQPDIIRVMAHGNPFSAIEPHTELGWQPCKLLMLDDGVIQCRHQWARIDPGLRIDASRWTRHDIAQMIDSRYCRGQPDVLEGAQQRWRRHHVYGANL